MTTTGVSEIFFFVEFMCLKILFFSISTPENVYLGKKYFDLRWISS